MWVLLCGEAIPSKEIITCFCGYPHKQLYFAYLCYHSSWYFLNSYLLWYMHTYRLQCIVRTKHILVATCLSWFSLTLLIVICHCQLSTFNCYISTINCNLFMFNRQMSNINCHIKTINCQMPMFKCQLLINNCQK